MGIVCIVGDNGWWLWIVIPLYSIYAAWGAFNGVRSGFAGLGGDDGDATATGSKRQKKLEKRGGKRMHIDDHI